MNLKSDQTIRINKQNCDDQDKYFYGQRKKFEELMKYNLIIYCIIFITERTHASFWVNKEVSLLIHFKVLKYDFVWADVGDFFKTSFLLYSPLRRFHTSKPLNLLQQCKRSRQMPFFYPSSLDLTQLLMKVRPSANHIRCGCCRRRSQLFSGKRFKNFILKMVKFMIILVAIDIFAQFI